jgi:hypothetical protein
VAVDGVTQACRTAIADAITAAGVTCRKYPAWDIGSGSIATLGTPRWELQDGYDQRYGIRAIVFPIRLYQVIDGSVEKSLEYVDIALQNVIDGLGADRTLGGKVANSGLDTSVTQEHYREPNGTAYTVTTLEIAVAPFPNAA